MKILAALLAYAVFAALVLVWNYGAHMNETDEEQGDDAP